MGCQSWLTNLCEVCKTLHGEEDKISEVKTTWVGGGGGGWLWGGVGWGQ